ncbi:MAG: HlyD family type I secretion periplasmic adaptor subunit [Geminicoccaceae bacterium]
MPSSQRFRAAASPPAASAWFLAIVSLGLIGVVGGASWFEVDLVSRGGGQVLPSIDKQMVQHLEGGIVTEILAKEGDLVSEGDVLLRVETRFAQAELEEKRVELRAQRARLARLKAEAQGDPEPSFAPELREAAAGFVATEEQLFRRRRASLDEQLAILADQAEQTALERDELKTRQTNLERERSLLAQQLKSLEGLSRVGAISDNEVLERRTEFQRLRTRLDDTRLQIPRMEAALSEAERRSSEMVLRFRAEADEKRAEADLAIAQLDETIGALQDRSRRSDVRAPVDGVVNKLLVSTVGGVVHSGDDLVEIVPSDQSIIVEARLEPSDRAEVWPGLPAVVKISAYDYAVFGGLQGRVVDISADALQDDQGQPYFRVRLEAASNRLGPDRPVVPGMTADVDILTGRHTIMSYLLTPFNRMAERAFRD